MKLKHVFSQSFSSCYCSELSFTPGHVLANFFNPLVLACLLWKHPAAAVPLVHFCLQCSSVFGLFHWVCLLGCIGCLVDSMIICWHYAQFQHHSTNLACLLVEKTVKAHLVYWEEAVRTPGIIVDEHGKPGSGPGRIDYETSTLGLEQSFEIIWNNFYRYDRTWRNVRQKML